jgi:EmrB/QacA subfamily drug resistance transporter
MPGEATFATRQQIAPFMLDNREVDNSQQVPLDLKSTAGRFTLTATILGSAMVFLDSTVVTVAIPTIQKDFSAAFSGLQWVSDAYLVTLTAFLLIGGSFGDIFGRRRAFIGGLIGFTLGSFLCGIAPNVGFLIAARAVQGLGGALLVPASLAIITATYSEDQRGRAIGIWAATSGLGAAVGPLLAGGLVDAFSWRWIFYVNVPLAFLTLILTARSMPETRDEQAIRHLPTASGITAAVALGGATYALIQGPVDGFQSAQVVGAIVVSILGAVAYVLLEARAKQPMLPRGVFMNLLFSSVQMTTLALYFAIYGMFFYVVLAAQQIHHLTALESGAALLPITLLLLAGSPSAGKLAGKIGPKIPIFVGGTLCAASALIAMLWAPGKSYASIMLPALIVFGVGLCLIVAPITSAAVLALGQAHAGIASAINNAVARLAALLAFAILPGISLATFAPALHQETATAAISIEQRHELFAQEDKQGGLEASKDASPVVKAQVRSIVERSFYRGYRSVMIWVAVAMFSGALIALLLLHKPSEHDMEMAAPPV